MAAGGGIAVPDAQEQKPSSPGPLRLHMPERRFEPINPAPMEGSSPEEAEDTRPLEEGELQSTIAVSIGREQTRLASPQTPAAEKAAALEGMGGFFDESPEEEMDEPSMPERLVKRDDEGNVEPVTPPRPRPHSGSMPSPWKAGPQTFERHKDKDQAGGPTGMLADLNIRRYMNNINLPSMPRAPSLRDFTVPSIGSILGSVRSHSPSRKPPTRTSRANTIATAKPEAVTTERHTREKVKNGDETIPHVERNLSTQSKLAQVDGSSSSTLQSPRSPNIRRSTSDQSLYLRRVTSTNTSLGDDSRWEHVQEQVNSRSKAIRDSLQDSNIKFPSISNLPSLSSFRPDFTRIRANSGTKITAVPNGTTASNGPSFRDPPSLRTRTAVKDQAVKQQQAPIRHPHLDHAIEHLAGDLVILGGYRGSILRSAKPPHRQLWVPVKVGLNIRKVNLEVGLEQEDEEIMAESIYASGMLSHIGPVDMGRRLLKRLRGCKNVQEGRLRIHDYGWDWRLSPHLSSRRFMDFLEKLPCNQSPVSPRERGATVVAHSMGGLITRHVVNQRPELFAGVVYAGVPQHCINILGPLRNGDEVLLSSKVLTAQVNFTLRSSYLLLPDDGHCFINKESKEEYPVNFFDPATWEEHAFSPCVGQVKPAAIEKKSLFDTIADSLPSLPSLPLTNKKPSEASTDLIVKAASKVADLNSPIRAADPQMSPPSRPPNNSEITLPKPAALAYLSRTLAEVLTFRHELAHNPTHEFNNTYPPIALIYANNTPTVAAAQVSSRQAIKRADAYDDLKFGSGDGVVLAKAAMLPNGYKAVRGGKLRTERGHVGLLGDLEAVGRSLEAVRKGRRSGIGLGHARNGGG